MKAPQYFVTEISTAVSELNLVRSRELCRDLINSLPIRKEPFPVKSARKILSVLRRKRYFIEMCQVADALISDGLKDAQIRRQYAQALIDLGQLAGALAFLENIVKDETAPEKEVIEAWGLIGRVYKQTYVNHPEAVPAKKQQVLNNAIRSYKCVYDPESGDQLWHGINLVALLARAQRDKIKVSVKDDYRTLAKTIRDEVGEKDEEGHATLWDYGTAMEAAVALEAVDDAVDWAEKYVARAPDAFELHSTIRQLEEVWQMKAVDPMGHKLLPLLKASLLATDDGDVNLSSVEFSNLKRIAGEKELELVYGPDSYKRIKWLKLALDSCQAIGLVSRRSGEGVGTGFVINGRSLSPKLDDDWYFLTNSHVVTNDIELIRHTPPHRRPLLPMNAHITFELLFEKEPREFKVKELVWTSPPEELDVTLLKLDQPFYDKKVISYPICSDLDDPSEKPRIYIAGHPGGRSLTISLQDNHLIEFNEDKLQYRTPTDPGSSGSPIFNNQWELVGLHHAGSRQKESLRRLGHKHEANEGIRIGAIVEAIEKAM